MNREFDWNLFRTTLSGATKQLAYSCEVDLIAHGTLYLVCDPRMKSLVDTYGKKLANEVAPTKLMIRLEA